MVYGLISQSCAGMMLAKKLMAEGHTVIAFDVEADCRREMATAGIVTTSSVQAVLLHLPKEKTVHVVMAEGSAREAVLKLLASELGPGARILTEK